MGFIKEVPMPVNQRLCCIPPWWWNVGVGSLWRCDSCERIYERVAGEHPWKLQDPEKVEPEGGHWEYGVRDMDREVVWHGVYGDPYLTPEAAGRVELGETRVRRWVADPGPWEVVE